MLRCGGPVAVCTDTFLRDFKYIFGSNFYKGQQSRYYAMSQTLPPSGVRRKNAKCKSSDKKMNFCRKSNSWKWISGNCKGNKIEPSVTYCFCHTQGVDITGNKYQNAPKGPNPTCHFRDILAQPWDPQEGKLWDCEGKTRGQDQGESSPKVQAEIPPDGCFYCGAWVCQKANKKGGGGDQNQKGSPLCAQCQSCRDSHRVGKKTSTKITKKKKTGVSKKKQVKGKRKENPNNVCPCVTYIEPSELTNAKNLYKSLQSQWDRKQIRLGRTQGLLFKLRNKLQEQSVYCAKFGSVLTSLVWRVSRLKPVVEMFLSNSNTIDEFLKLVNGGFVSFLTSYGRCSLSQPLAPTHHWEEFYFVTALAGVVSNLAAVPEGRCYLATSSQGRQLVHMLAGLLPDISQETQYSEMFLRLLMTLLFNVSINREGLSLIQEDKVLMGALTQIVAAPGGIKSQELKVTVLRLLESLTTDIRSQTAFNLIQQNIPVGRIEYFSTSSDDPEVREYSTNILENVRNAQKALDRPTWMDQPPQPIKEECANITVAGQTVGRCRKVLEDIKKKEELQLENDLIIKRRTSQNDPKIDLPRFL